MNDEPQSYATRNTTVETKSPQPGQQIIDKLEKIKAETIRLLGVATDLSTVMVGAEPTECDKPKTEQPNNCFENRVHFMLTEIEFNLTDISCQIDRVRHMP